jgi:hypothetical protein
LILNHDGQWAFYLFIPGWFFRIWKQFFTVKKPLFTNENFLKKMIKKYVGIIKILSLDTVKTS